MNKSLEKILVDLIKYELDLPDTYGKTSSGDVIPSVIAYSQNIKLFNTQKLQITVKTVSTKDYSNRVEFKENPNPSDDGKDAYIETQYLNQSCLFT